MSRENPRIVGEAFKKYVNEQINARQQVYGSGFLSDRSINQTHYLNSRTSFVKVLSSVSIESFGLRERLSNLGLDWKVFSTTKLAESFALFNTIGGYQGNQRAGIPSAYGFGGTEFGLQPPPGIVSFDVNHLNRGSLRKGQISLKAYNRFQFNVIETLYMRLGFTILIEWGHSRILNPDLSISNMGNTLGDDFWFNRNNDGATALRVQSEVEKYRERTNGNYDALFGRITNFNWNFNSDGSYDITIDFLSLGSIVESLKVNFPLHKYKGNRQNSETKENEGHQSALSNLLYSVRKVLDEDTPNTCVREEIKNLEYFSVGVSDFEVDLRTLGLDILRPLTVPDKKYYIRLGHLLEIIEQEIIDRLNDSPCIDINYSDNNYCNFIDNIISVDPNICVVNINHINPDIVNPELIPFSDKSKTRPFTNTNNVGRRFGRTMNIYLNFQFVEDILKQAEAGKLDLFTLLDKICKGMNSAFGGVVDFEVIYNEDRHELEIIDQNLQLRVDENCQPIERFSNPLIIYGFDPQTNPDQTLSINSNFVKDYSISSKISPEIAAQISIGAAASSGSVSEDATAFSRWNSGMIDRFQLTFETNEKKKNAQDYCEEENTNDINTNNISGPQTGTAANTTVFNNNVNYSFVLTEEEEWEEYVKSVFHILFDLIPREYSYFSQDADQISEGKNALNRLLVSKNKKEREDSGDTKGGEIQGFIPIELSLTLDGISGMTIYNQIRVNSQVLPSNYPDLLDFVITGVGHKVEGQDWVTTITALPKATDKKTKENQGNTNF